MAFEGHTSDDIGAESSAHRRAPKNFVQGARPISRNLILNFGAQYDSHAPSAGKLLCGLTLQRLRSPGSETGVARVRFARTRAMCVHYDCANVSIKKLEPCCHCGGDSR